MTQQTPPPADKAPADLTAVSYATLLGLREEGDEAQWARIRATQLHAGRQLALFLLGTNLIATAAIATLFVGLVPLWMIGAWALLIGITSVGVAIRRLATPHRTEGCFASIHDLRATFGEGIALAIMWAVPTMLFNRVQDSGHAYAFWMILSVLMTAVAFAMAPLALSAIALRRRDGAGGRRHADPGRRLCRGGRDVSVHDDADPRLPQPRAVARRHPRHPDGAGRTQRHRQPALARIRG